MLDSSAVGGLVRPPTPTFGGQRPTSIRPLTAAYQAASASHQVMAPTPLHPCPLSSLSFPPPPPPSSQVINSLRFNLPLLLRLYLPIPILHRRALVYLQRHLSIYLDGEERGFLLFYLYFISSNFGGWGHCLSIIIISHIILTYHCFGIF